MREAQVGDVVWVVVGNDQQKAKVLEFDGNTQVIVELLTGSQAGKTVTAPWGIAQQIAEIPGKEID